SCKKLNLMNSIVQKRKFEKRVYTINHSSGYIDVEYRSLKNKFKYKIHITEVGSDIQYQSDNTLPGKIFVAVAGVAAVSCFLYYFFGNDEKPGLWLFNGVLALFFVVFGYLKPHMDDIIIVGGNKNVYFFREKPSEEIVLIFAKNLIKLANDEKKRILANIDLKEEEFMQNINW